MEISPFTQWPFWHYFTLHMQNVNHITREFRIAKPSYVILENELPVIKDVMKKCFVYDFMNDTIIAVSSMKLDLIMMMNIDRLTDPRVINASNTPGMMFIFKGIFNETKQIGGEILPLIGSYKDMGIMIQSLSTIMKYSSNDSPSYKLLYDMLGPQPKANVDALLKGPVYSNHIINVILGMRKPKDIVLSSQAVVTGKDTSKVETRIDKLIGQPIPEGKAINVKSGMLVMTTTKGYNISEYEVVSPSTGVKRTVKFAFPTNMSEADHSAYLYRLQTVFKAVPTSTSQSVEAAREATFLNPIILEQSSYTNIFGSDEGFVSYVKNVNEIGQVAIPDTNRIVEGEVKEMEEEVAEEEEVEEIED